MLDRLDEPHVVPLTRFVAGLRARGLSVPNVDPDDGGVDARALFLLESPGPKAVNSGFVSRTNPDPSARNMGLALDAAGFDRKEVVIWNVVPQCISTIDENRNASPREIAAAAPDTQAFIDLLPNLRVVVFCGRKAQQARPGLRFRPGIAVRETFHPGAQSWNHSSRREHLLATFAEAARLVLPLRAGA
jgi:hypothetical protein